MTRQLTMLLVLLATGMPSPAADSETAKPGLSEPTRPMGRLARKRQQMAERRARPRPAALPVWAPDAAGPELQVLSQAILDPGPGGNNDGWIQPGETVQMMVTLYNAGKSPGQSVYGQLNLAEVNPNVTILDKVADWADIPVGATVATSSPHFSLQVSNVVPCGYEVPLSLEVRASGGYEWTIPIALRLGRIEEVDLTEDATRRVNEADTIVFGADNDDSLGTSVAFGDVNGDGFDDVLMGAWPGDGPTNGNADAGEVRLVYGGSIGREPLIDVSFAPFGTSFINSNDAGDRLGGAVASGDVNGDGYDDVIIGALLARGPSNGRSFAGDVYVIYGQQGSLASSITVQVATEAKAIYGANSEDSLGSSVAAGDVNGDGYDDIVLAAGGGDGPTGLRSDAGEVWILYGGGTALPPTTDLASPPAASTVIYGSESLDYLGGFIDVNYPSGSLAVGDLNGDGRDDVVMVVPSAHGPANTRIYAGEAWIVYGQSSMPSSIDLAAPPSYAIVIYGADAYDQLKDVATGDVNGDGYMDVALAAPYADGPGNQRSYAGDGYLIPGQSAQLPAAIDLALLPAGSSIVFQTEAGGFMGYGGKLGIGDLDGDGFDELILGVPWASVEGRVWAVKGRPEGLPRVVDLMPSTHVVSISAGATGDELGTIGAGDLNGDGFDDLALGAIGGERSGGGKTNTGEVHFVTGAPTSTYWHKSETFSFIDASTGANLGLICDDCSVGYPIGFSFAFYGERFTTVYVSSNGFVSFLPIPDAISAANRCIDSKIPSSLSSLPLIIAPFWDDLDLRFSGSVYALLSGTAPNRRLTIEWSNAPHFPATGAATFEVSLFESTGQILMQWQDVVFGSISDLGATAVVGTQNRTGAAGTNYGCNQAILSDGMAVSFNPATPLFVDNMESFNTWAFPSTYGKWTISGAWHTQGATPCPGENFHGRTQSMYSTSSCTYAAFMTDILYAPQIIFPEDGRLSFWRRIQLADAGDIATCTSVGAATTTWLTQAGPTGSTGFTYAGPYFHGSSFAGPVTVNWQFVSDGSGADLGFMVDDVKIVGCNAKGITSLADAKAFAEPVIYCGDGVNTGLLDAVGSSCGDGSAPTGYQWLEDGVPIPGATSVTYTIPASHPAGSFGFAVVVTCPAGSATSPPQQVDIVAPPSIVGNTLMVTKQGGGADIRFNWTDVSGSTEYVVLEDPVPSGPFATQTGTAPSGGTGLTVPMPAGSLVCYHVAGSNPTCGIGSK